MFLGVYERQPTINRGVNSAIVFIGTKVYYRFYPCNITSYKDAYVSNKKKGRGLSPTPSSEVPQQLSLCNPPKIAHASQTAQLRMSRPTACALFTPR